MPKKLRLGHSFLDRHRLEQAIIKQKLSTEAVAGLSGVSMKTIERWRKGKAWSVSTWRLHDVEKALRLKEGELELTTEHSENQTLTHVEDARTAIGIAPFFGRDELIQSIVDHLTDNLGNPVCVIEGPGGIGKTALARRAGEFLSQQGVVDQHIMVDFRGFDELYSPLTPVEAIRSLIRASSPTLAFQDLPNSYSELLHIWHNQVHNENFVITLDNVYEAEKHKEIFDCKVPPYFIMTSRVRQPFPYVMVGPLSRYHAAQMACHFCNTRDRNRVTLEQAQVVAEVAKYNPLMIKNISGQIAVARLPAQEVIKSLDKNQNKLQTDNDQISERMNLSLKLLKQSSVDSFFKLALFSSFFDRQIVEHITSGNGDQVLDELSNIYLLETMPESNIMKIHDIHKSAASLQLEKSPQRLLEARTGFVVALGKHITNLNSMYRAGGALIGKAIKMLDLYVSDLQKAKEYFDLYKHRNDMKNMIRSFAMIVNQPIIGLRIDVAQRIDWLRVAVSGARELEDKHLLAETQSNLGDFLERNGHTVEAREILEEAERANRALGLEDWRSRNIGCIAACYLREGELSVAESFCRQALKIQIELSLEDFQSNQHGLLGRIYERMGQDEKAKESFFEAVSLARKHGHYLFEATYSVELAKYIEDVTEQTSLLHRSKELYTRLGLRSRAIEVNRLL